MILNRDEIKTEAIKRMELLDIYPTAIEEFKKSNKLNLSEGLGSLYWLSEEEYEAVRQFEEKYDTIVYHVIHNRMEFGEVYSFLYVPNERSEWSADIRDLKDLTPMAYVYNADDPVESEFGRIGIKPSFGGLIRTA